MTYALTLPAATPAAPEDKRDPLRSLLGWIAALIARLGAHIRLSRLTERQLRDIGLVHGDIEMLRSLGSSRDAMTRLAIRAGQRADTEVAESV